MNLIDDLELRETLGISSPEESPQDYYIFPLLPEDFLSRIASGDYTRSFFPRFSDRDAWKKAAEDPEKQIFFQTVMKLAEEALGSELPFLTYSEFCRFSVDGNRTGYETPFFRAMTEMGALGTAICITGDKDKYMTALLDRIVLLLEKSTWCFPAHCVWLGKGKLHKYQAADLFACQCAAQFALLHYLLGDELEAEAEGISERMREKACRESIDKVLSPVNSSYCHWYHADDSGNWIAWCTSNCLVTALFLVEDPVRLAQIFQVFLYPLSRYAFFCPEDGYSCEGITYFPFSAGRMFMCFDLFELMLPGSAERIFADSKIRAMLEYGTKIRFGKTFSVFSDARSVATIPYWLAHGCAERCDSEAYRRLAADGTLVKDYIGGMGDVLWMFLKSVFAVNRGTVQVKEKAPEQVLYKDNFGIVRAGDFEVSVKAGSNTELHNHNDLGHFAVCCKGEHIIIDAGTDTYSRINFSDQRYTLWYTRGSGHNAPVLDGVEQQASMSLEFTAALDMVSDADQQTLVCDLSKAYPSEAGVRSFIRRATVAAEGITIRDVIDWDGKEAVINLFCIGKPEICADGVLLGGNVLLQGEGISLRETALQEEHFSNWSGPVYRVTMVSCNKDYRLRFKAK